MNNKNNLPLWQINQKLSCGWQIPSVPSSPRRGEVSLCKHIMTELGWKQCAIHTAVCFHLMQSQQL